MLILTNYNYIFIVLVLTKIIYQDIRPILNNVDQYTDICSYEIYAIN